MIVVDAIYRHGMLVPVRPLELDEGQEVRLHIDNSTPLPESSISVSEAERRYVSQIRATQSLNELITLIKSVRPSIQG